MTRPGQAAFWAMVALAATVHRSEGADYRFVGRDGSRVVVADPRLDCGHRGHPPGPPGLVIRIDVGSVVVPLALIDRVKTIEADPTAPAAGGSPVGLFEGGTGRGATVRVELTLVDGSKVEGSVPKSTRLRASTGGREVRYPLDALAEVEAIGDRPRVTPATGPGHGRALVHPSRPGTTPGRPPIRIVGAGFVGWPSCPDGCSLPPNVGERIAPATPGRRDPAARPSSFGLGRSRPPLEAPGRSISWGEVARIRPSIASAYLSEPVVADLRGGETVRIAEGRSIVPGSMGGATGRRPDALGVGGLARFGSFDLLVVVPFGRSVVEVEAGGLDASANGSESGGLQPLEEILQ